MHIGLLDPALMSSIRILYQPIVRMSDLRMDYVEILARAATTDGGLDRAGDDRGGDGCQRGLDASDQPPSCAAHWPNIAVRVRQQDLGGRLQPAARCHAASGAGGRGSRPSAPRPACRQQISGFELTERHPVHDLKSAAYRDHRVARCRLLSGAGRHHARHAQSAGADGNADPQPSKLDRSVVVSAAPSDQAFHPRQSAVAIRKGQHIIAEGIETPYMRDEMRRLGVTHGQGFLFSHPMPALPCRRF